MGSTKSKPVQTTGSNGNTTKTEQKASPKQKDNISAADRATLQLKLQRDKLNAVLRRSTNVLAREEQQAREFIAQGRRDKALYCLKRKKLQEKQMEQVEGMLTNIQASIDSLDFARLEAHVVSSLKEGTKVLTDLQKGMSPEEVEKVMDDAFDAIALSREVSDLLVQQLGGIELDDDSLLEELIGTTTSTTSKTSKTTTEQNKTDETKTKAVLDSVVVPSGDVRGHNSVVQDEEDETTKNSERRSRVLA